MENCSGPGWAEQPCTYTALLRKLRVFVRFSYLKGKRKKITTIINWLLRHGFKSNDLWCKSLFKKLRKAETMGGPQLARSVPTKGNRLAVSLSCRTVSSVSSIWFPELLFSTLAQIIQALIFLSVCPLVNSLSSACSLELQEVDRMHLLFLSYTSWRLAFSVLLKNVNCRYQHGRYNEKLKIINKLSFKKK